MITLALKRVDEFDQKTDAEVVQFSIDGIVYEIDLGPESKRQLYRDLERYINAGRKVGAKSSGKKSSTKPTPRPAAEQALDNDAVRAWAKKSGKAISDRGRIPRDIIDEFKASHEPNASQPAFSGA